MVASANRIPRAFGSLDGLAHRRFLWLWLVVVAALLPTFAGAAEPLQPLLDRIDRLERDLRTLNMRVARGGGPTVESSIAAPAAYEDSTGSLARLDIRITDLEEEVRSLTGKVETVEFSVRRMSERLEKLVSDVDFRLRAIESRGGATGAAVAGSTADIRPPAEAGRPSDVPVASLENPRLGAPNPAPSTTPGTLGTLTSQELAAASRTLNTPPADPSRQPMTPRVDASAAAPAAQTGSAEDKYRQAFSLLRQARYPEAEAALREFVDANPNHELTGNARYWLAETYYVRAQYAQAAQVFLESYTKDPKGNKAPDSLLKLGMSLSVLDKRREACAAYNKLDKEFPEAPGNIKKVVQREREQNGCR
jgi:tol-pal system protein YbgF